MCTINTTTCNTCGKKSNFGVEFCDKIDKGMMRVDENVPATRDAHPNQSTLRTTVRFSDKYGNRIMYLSDVMVTRQNAGTCGSCSR